MTDLKQKSRLRRLAATAVVAAGLAASALPSMPAQARVFVGFGFGVPGVWGYYAPPPYYYRYPAYYGYSHRYYYRYPYAYPAGVYFGHPFYRHHPHPRWRRYGR